MKVVINSCYGGFSLSPLAVKRMAELQGKECYFLDKDNEEITMEKCERTFFWSAVSIKDFNKMLCRKNWNEMTEKERTKEHKLCNSAYLDQRPENRSDPHLIQVVEELGDKANGTHAKLRIVEIPDDIQYSIEEYDGIEHIAETHNTWY